MNRILFISHDSGRTGAPIGLLAFMRWLRAQGGCEIGTILRAPGPLVDDFRALGPTLMLGNSFLSRSRLGRRVRSHLPRAWRGDAGAIRKFFVQGRYDAIYSNTITNGAILETLAGRAPVVTHVHELEYWIERSGAENLRRVLSCTNAFIAASFAVRDNLVQNHGVPAEKIAVVHEHIRELPALPTAEDKVSARRALGIPQDAFVVGSCGAEHWRKGRDLIPQLLLALRRERPDRAFHFVWVGRPGTRDEEFALQHDLHRAGVEAFYHSSGGEVADPFRYYPAMDVFALLSRDDPYPLACLEAAALEMPVVCFADAGGMPEFARDGCGFVAPYLDLSAMARDVVHLAEDSTLTRNFGKAAREKVARENLPAATGPRLRAVLDGLLQRVPVVKMPSPASTAVANVQ